MAGPSTASRVLRLLLAADGPCSGQEMGTQLGVSRAAISKTIAGLRQAGLVIESSPRRGYRLVSEPETPLAARVEARLTPGGLGAPLTYFPRLASTNLEARRSAEAGAPHGACLVADYQSAGRGRLDRRWIAPAGSCLLFSLILRPKLAIYQVFGLTLLASLALCRALEQLSGLEPMIKWPNDVYLDQRKLAGVLTEFASRAEQVEHVVVGVGLNVNLRRSQLRKLGQPATSLATASGRPWDRGVLLAEVLNQMTRLYQDFEQGRHDRLRAAYERRFLLAGRRVRVVDGDSQVTGVAQGLNPDGSLVLRGEDGRTITIRHGDVSLRPAD